MQPAETFFIRKCQLDIMICKFPLMNNAIKLNAVTVFNDKTNISQGKSLYRLVVGKTQINKLYKHMLHKGFLAEIMVNKKQFGFQPD